jgi:hypothetical protein
MKLQTIALVAFVLNLLDAAFTAYWHIQGGVAEANPVAAYFLAFGTGYLWLFKATLVGLGLILCLFVYRKVNKKSTKRLAAIAIWLAFITYGLINAYHLAFYAFFW